MGILIFEIVKTIIIALIVARIIWWLVDLIEKL